MVFVVGPESGDMDREDLVRVHGDPEEPPEVVTLLAADEDGDLYQLEYGLDTITKAE